MQGEQLFSGVLQVLLILDAVLGNVVLVMNINEELVRRSTWTKF